MSAPRPIELARRGWAALQARRTTWLALGAVGFGALAVLGAHRYIADRLAAETARLQPRHEMVEVVVAKRELRRGDVVGTDTMALRAMPREFAPGGSVSPARFDALAGSRLLVPMRAGEPLLAAAVAGADPPSFSARVRPGIRAMTVAVDEVNSLSGMLQPGDRIDLLLSVRPTGATGQPLPEVTRTVMQGVTVLATGRQARPSALDDASGGRPYTSITVEVDPEQAQKLVVAQRSGKLTAVLRNPDDRMPVADRRLDVNGLLGIAPPAPTVIATGPTPVEVIVGGRGQVVPQSGTPAAPGVPAPGGAAQPAVAPPPAGSSSAASSAAAQGESAPRPAGLDLLTIPGLAPPSPHAPAAVPLYR
ncbi:MAG: hypothetical protein RJA99_599 [Pseudomonadota bacterium]|jgi:pilus assembly protein CpaB